MMERSTLLLLCDEELLPSSPSCSPVPSPRRELYCSASSMPWYSDSTDDDCDDDFQNYMQREHVYATQRGYAEHLQIFTHLSAARFRAIRWIFLTSGRLNLGFATAFNAVNYLDRFISINCCVQWESWMVELLSIACLSIASKYEEVIFPSLHDFQLEDLEHSFETSTIQRMELAVLKVLDWRLSCVIPYSYVDLLARRMHSHHVRLTTRTTELLVHALLDTRFLEYDACAIAASALRCSVKELRPLEEADTFLSIFTRLIPEEYLGALNKCCKIMEEHAGGALAACVKNYGCPLSPVTVIPVQRTAVSDCYVDIDSSFSKPSDPSLNPKKRRSE